MREKFLNNGALLLVTVILLWACAPVGPSNESVKNDWDTFLKAQSGKYCVSFTGFEIISSHFEGASGEVIIKITGDWNNGADSVETSGPCDAFKRSNGQNQSVELKMVYEKSDQGWNLKGFQPK